MAVGDVFDCVPTSVADAAFLAIQPSGTAEAVIHNIYYGGAVEFYKYDGTNSIKFDSDAAAGGRLGYAFHVKNSCYIRIKNVSGAAIYIAYDGIYTKA